MSKNILSHSEFPADLEAEVERTYERIVKTGDIPIATVEEQLKVLKQLTEFGIGQYMLLHKGLNGYWTRLFNLHRKNPNEHPIANELEKFWLERAPEPLASQQRFEIFQKLLQQNIKDNSSVCSVPCGMMDDLLTLELNNYPKIKLCGIDIDEESVKHAKENADERGLLANCAFFASDAWNLNIENEFDIITSNGLNIYVKEDDHVEKLYQSFFKALKTDGILISSFLTPPPSLSSESSYEMSKIDEEDLRLHDVMVYVINANWLNYRTEKNTIEQLKSVGFKCVEIFYDHARIFPTFLARK